MTSPLVVSPKEPLNWVEKGVKVQEVKVSESNPNTVQFSLLWNQILILSDLQGDGTHF